MFLGFTHFFGGQSQNRSKFTNLEKFRPRNDNSANSESKRH